MPNIIPHLWFNKEAKQAAELYTSLLPNSKIINSTVIKDTPSGDADLLTIQIAGQEFMLISAGPYFKFTPAISFLIACDSVEEVDLIYEKLSPGSTSLMPLGEYPFSKKYVWLADKFGLSWQIMLMGDMKYQQKITPTLMFVGSNCGKTEEAINNYLSIFKDSKINSIMRYNKGEEPDKEGTIKHAEFTLEGVDFAAMDSAYEHKFTFNEAISFIVHCKDQAEIDHYWNKLTADPKAEQCGWLKDKYGVSWQIVPTIMNEMMQDQNPEKRLRVTQAFLKMKKFNIAELKKAYEES